MQTKEQRHQSYLRHRKKNLARQAKYRLEHSDHIQKYMNKYYIDNRESLIEQRKTYYKEVKKYFDDYKLARGCSICGYNKCASALEFHHSDCRKVGEKKFDIARAIGDRKKIKDIEKEIEKCVIFCANCHREYHENHRNEN